MTLFGAVSLHVAPNMRNCESPVDCLATCQSVLRRIVYKLNSSDTADRLVQSFTLYKSNTTALTSSIVGYLIGDFPYVESLALTDFITIARNLLILQTTDISTAKRH